MTNAVPTIPDPEVSAEFDFGPYKMQVAALWKRYADAKFVADYRGDVSSPLRTRAEKEVSLLMPQIEDLTVDVFITSDGLYEIDSSNPNNPKESGVFAALHEAIYSVYPEGPSSKIDDGFVKRILQKVYLRMKGAGKHSAVDAFAGQMHAALTRGPNNHT